MCIQLTHRYTQVHINNTNLKTVVAIPKAFLVLLIRKRGG